MSEQEDKNQSNHPAPMAVRREIQNSGSGLMSGDVDLQVRTAKAFPRDISKFKQQAHEMVAIDKETAESCSYAYKRGGKIIEGPSTRLAEIIAASWGNLRVAARTTGTDEGFIYAESVCWDLENNVAVSYETRRRITNKDGQRFNDDMVGITGNATTSIAFRNSVFRVVPRAYVNEIWKESRKVAAGGQTLEQTRLDMLNWFESQGVTKQQILDLLNIPALDDISKEQLAMLRGFAQSIKDGVTSIESIFHGDEQQDETDSPQDENARPEDDLPAAESETQPDKTKGIEKPVDIVEAKAETLNLILSKISEMAPGDDMHARAKQLKLLDSTFGRTELKKIELLPLAILQAGLVTLRNQAAAEVESEDIPV